MFEFLYDTYQRLIQETPIDFFRFLYHQINLDNRLTGIVGPRGVGKTTLMLQLIKTQFVGHDDVFYFSADNFYFQDNLLIEFVADLYENEGIQTLFIDEIHKYPTWNQELKNIYDSFPSLKVIFSGSSSIDLVRGTYDLSRRAVLKKLPGLSFREYLNFTTDSKHETISLENLLKNPMKYNQQIASIPRIRKYFKEYLAAGYYPYVVEDVNEHYQRIMRVVDKTIYEDIASFYNLKTLNLQYFKKILNFLATIPPGKINTNNVSRSIGLDNKTVDYYLSILNDVDLINLIYPHEGGHKLLRKPEKIFLNNTTLHHALSSQLGKPIEIDTLRELFFIETMINSGTPVFFNDIGDYFAVNHVFEIGGKNKTSQQIKSINNAYLVKDDITHAMKGIIPLYYFGFLT